MGDRCRLRITEEATSLFDIYVGRFITNSLAVFGQYEATGGPDSIVLPSANNFDVCLGYTGSYIFTAGSGAVLKYQPDGTYVAQVATSFGTNYGLFAHDSKVYVIDYSGAYLVREYDLALSNTQNFALPGGLSNIRFLTASDDNLWIADNSTSANVYDYDRATGTGGSVTSLATVGSLGSFPLSGIIVSPDESYMIAVSYSKIAVFTMNPFALVFTNAATGFSVESSNQSPLALYGTQLYATANKTTYTPLITMDISTETEFTQLYATAGDVAGAGPICIVPR